MKNRYRGIIAAVLILVLAGSPVKAAEGNVMPTEAKERITAQYGLELTSPVSPDWSGMDVGISGPVDILVSICRFMVSPLVFVIHELL